MKVAKRWVAVLLALVLTFSNSYAMEIHAKTVEETDNQVQNESVLTEDEDTHQGGTDSEEILIDTEDSEDEEDCVEDSEQKTEDTVEETKVETENATVEETIEETEEIPFEADQMESGVVADEEELLGTGVLTEIYPEFAKLSVSSKMKTKENLKKLATTLPTKAYAKSDSGSYEEVSVDGAWVLDEVNKCFKNTVSTSKLTTMTASDSSKEVIINYEYASFSNKTCNITVDDASIAPGGSCEFSTYMTYRKTFTEARIHLVQKSGSEYTGKQKFLMTSGISNYGYKCSLTNVTLNDAGEYVCLFLQPMTISDSNIDSLESRECIASYEPCVLDVRTIGYVTDLGGVANKIYVSSACYADTDLLKKIAEILPYKANVKTDLDFSSEVDTTGAWSYNETTKKFTNRVEVTSLPDNIQDPNNMCGTVDVEMTCISYESDTTKMTVTPATSTIRVGGSVQLSIYRFRSDCEKAYLGKIADDNGGAKLYSTPSSVSDANKTSTYSISSVTTSDQGSYYGIVCDFDNTDYTKRYAYISALPATITISDAQATVSKVYGPYSQMNLNSTLVTSANLEKIAKLIPTTAYVELTDGDVISADTTGAWTVDTANTCFKNTIDTSSVPSSVDGNRDALNNTITIKYLSPSLNSNALKITSTSCQSPVMTVYVQNSDDVTKLYRLSTNAELVYDSTTASSSVLTKESSLHKYTLLNATESNNGTYFSLRYIPSEAVSERILYACASVANLTITHTETTGQTVSATCTKTGSTGATTCSKCGKVISEGSVLPIDPDAHPTASIVTDKAVAATCKDTGLTEGSHCEACDKVIVAQTVTDKKAHTPSATFTWSSDGATCTYSITCSVCKETLANGNASISTKISQEANCSQVGKAVNSASATYSGKTYTAPTTREVEIPKDSTKHTNVVSVPDVAATCSSEGCEGATKCTGCGKTVSAGTVIPKDSTAHTRIVDDPAVEPTCTSVGKKAGRHCEGCKAVILAQETIPKLNHNAKVKFTWAEDKSTCSYTISCSLCGNTKLESGTATVTTKETPAVNCQTPGKKTYTAKVVFEGYPYTDSCDETLYADLTDENMHTKIQEGKHVAPTCTSGGYTNAKTCTDCGYTFEGTSDGTPKNPNNHPAAYIVTDKAVDATCTKTGLTEGSHCEACGESIVAQEEVPMLSHEPAQTPIATWSVDHKSCTVKVICEECGTVLQEKNVTATENVVPATCLAYGEAVYTASSEYEGKTYEATYKEQLPIDEDNHVVVTDAAVASTCEMAGLTEGSHCSVCRTVLVAQETVPALGHSYSEKSKATYIMPAIHSCSNCEKEIAVGETAYFTLLFDGNGSNNTSENTTAMESFTSHYINQTDCIPENIYQLDGKAFYEWNTEQNGSGISIGDECTIYDLVTRLSSKFDEEGKLTLYAQWANETPSAPKITKTEGVSNGIKLTWSQTDTAKQFKIYRSTSKTSWPASSLIATITDSNARTYTDTKITSGTTYYYKVVAGLVNDSPGSNIVEVPVIGTAAAPSVVNQSKGVKLSWATVKNATGYQVYRSVNGGSYTKITTTTALSYTDTSANTNKAKYQYKIEAYNTFGKTTSNAATFYKIAAPGKPTLTNEAKDVKVSWKAVSGVTGYYVYRSINGAAYKKIGTIKSGKTVKYTDKGAATNGKKYQYKIEAYYTVGGATYVSSASAAETTYFLKQQKISSLKNTKTRNATVKWSKNTSATGYEIQYATSSKFSGKKTVKITSKKTVTKKIKSLKKKKTYYVRIRAYKTSGSKKYYGAWSSTKKVKITK